MYTYTCTCNELPVAISALVACAMPRPRGMMMMPRPSRAPDLQQEDENDLDEITLFNDDDLDEKPPLGPSQAPAGHDDDAKDLSSMSETDKEDASVDDDDDVLITVDQIPLLITVDAKDEGDPQIKRQQVVVDLTARDVCDHVLDGTRMCVNMAKQLTSLRKEHKKLSQAHKDLSTDHKELLEDLMHSYQEKKQELNDLSQKHNELSSATSWRSKAYKEFEK